jgi:hypothetical protein
MPPRRTALDDPPDGMNDYERKLVANVREHGWQSTYVGAGEDAPSFAYSIGFWASAAIPEILILSLPSDVSHSILAFIFEEAASGFAPPVGTAVSGVTPGYDCYFFPIGPAAYGEYPLSCNWFYRGRDYPCLQLVWADQAGLFPWQPGFDERFRNDQPDLSAEGWRSHLAN